MIFKNRPPFADCISEINNTQIDNAKDIDVVIPMYNLTEYNDNYSKTSESYSNIIEMSQLIEYKILNHSNPRLK